MPTQKTLREIINNLIYQFYVNKNESRTQEEEDIKNEEDISQSLSEIKSLIKEKLPKELKRNFGAKKLNKKELTVSDVSDDYRKFGYNQALTEIEKIIELC